MKRTPFAPLSKQIAILASILGAGAFMSAPAIAQQTTTPSQSAPTTTPGQMDDRPMQEPMNQPMQEPMNQQDTSAMTIVDVASGSESFNTLVQAIQAAGVADTLASEGPYTVFAPTDEAFAQLPDGALEYLLQPENRSLLQQVLAYHVVRGEVTSDEIQTGAVETLNGGLAIRVTSDRVIVNNASVVQPDIQASNGVIHAVNRVLLPETLQRQLSRALGVQNIYQ